MRNHLWGYTRLVDTIGGIPLLGHTVQTAPFLHVDQKWSETPQNHQTTKEFLVPNGWMPCPLKENFLTYAPSQSGQ